MKIYYTNIKGSYSYTLKTNYNCGSANHPNKSVIITPQCQILHHTFTVYELRMFDVLPMINKI